MYNLVHIFCDYNFAIFNFYMFESFGLHIRQTVKVIF